MKPTIDIPKESRWLYDQNYHSILTYWANQKITISLGNLDKNYNVQLAVCAKNHGSLPNNYNNFEIDVLKAGAKIAALKVPASDTHFQTGTTTFPIAKGNKITLDLNWKNDYHVPGKYDVNILIGSIEVNLS